MTEKSSLLLAAPPLAQPEPELSGPGDQELPISSASSSRRENSLSQPGYFLSEATDVFAWLMHIQNIVDSKTGVKADARGNALEIAMSKAYPNGCRDCGKRICVCPPILQSTVGRIAHEVPTNRGTFGETGRFMTPERASEFFQRI